MPEYRVVVQPEVADEVTTIMERAFAELGTPSHALQGEIPDHLPAEAKAEAVIPCADARQARRVETAIARAVADGPERATIDAEVWSEPFGSWIDAATAPPQPQSSGWCAMLARLPGTK